MTHLKNYNIEYQNDKNNRLNAKITKITNIRG